MERGRPQRPLDGASGPARDLAAALRELRAAAGNPSYRTMAATAHFSPATLARAAAGHRLPNLDVVLAYATACGGERAEWEQRWRACAKEMASTPTEITAVSALPDQAAESGQLPAANQLRPEGPGPARGRRPGRRSVATLAAVTLTATALLVGIGAAADAPTPADPAGARAAASDSVAMEPLGRACDPNGIIARMPARARSSRGQAARVRASFEAGFEPSRDGWSPWWGKGNVVEAFTASQAYDGKRAL